LRQVPVVRFNLTLQFAYVDQGGNTQEDEKGDLRVCAKMRPQVNNQRAIDCRFVDSRDRIARNADVLFYVKARLTLEAMSQKTGEPYLLLALGGAQEIIHNRFLISSI